MNRQEQRTIAYNELMNSKNKAVSDAARESGAMLVDTTHYIAAEVSDKSGIQQLVTSKSEKAVGVQSFDKNKFNDGEHFLADSIVATFASADNSTATTASTADYKTAAPAALKNAELVWSQNGEKFRFAINDLVSRTNQPFRELGHAPIIEAGKTFELNIEYPEGAKVPADKKYFVRFDIRGNKFLK